jgi:tetratricopeptide (TPR) repeat protein
LSGGIPRFDTIAPTVKITAAVALFCSLNVLAQTVKSNPVQMAIPGVKGVLEFDVGPAGFDTRVRPDGKEVQLQAFDRSDHLGVTAFLQRVTFPASAEKCRDEWWPGSKKALRVQRDDLQETLVQNGIARVEYLVQEFQGKKVHQKTIHAYLGEGNLCAEIHLSKVDFVTEDERLFDDLLLTVRLLPETAASAAPTQNKAPQDHDSSYYFGQGSKLYLQHNYSSAAESYQKALDLEKQKRTLSKDYFRVLVDNLGMSYGISGKLLEAKATFEYGLTQDPEYPMFYYNLACTYGEMNKMDDTLTQLRLAYMHKANMIAGETLPDPLKDDSFRHFADKERFVKAIHEMRQ